MSHGTDQQVIAVKSGYWPIFRFNPLKPQGQRFTLDCKEPSIPVKEFLYNETRFSSMLNRNPAHAAELLEMAQINVSSHWERMAALKNL